MARCLACSASSALLLFCAAAAIGAENEEAAEGTLQELEVHDYDRDHWAFKPLARPKQPAVKNAAWVQTPIDRFILAALEKKGLAPLPEADRETLIRRLSFDLLGLPPAPAEIDAFLADDSPDAYERLVERMLGSHHYGERWAQHWLDLARFAETDGFEHDKLRKDAWRYRDWVIDALNADTPYDRFVHLQLAGDELSPGDAAARIATAFCLSGPDMPDINSQDERKHNVLNELTSTVSSALLGLQMGCAQCHDHKYDPIGQHDFYRLRAVFAPSVQVKKNVSLDVLAEQAGGAKPEVYVSHLMIRGDWQRPGPEVTPDYPRIANPWDDRLVDDAKLYADRAGKSSGLRTALAVWITRGDHPLTTRVIVNRLWQHHFGEGLSRTPSDFGLMGDPPSHEELLDWLATELVRRNWSLKQLHRLIVTSAVYRQAGRWTAPSWSDEQRRRAAESLAASRAADPNNYLLARFPRRRLSGEEVRDAMLSAAGVLNTKDGGPGVMPPIPPELEETLLKGQWEVDADPSEHDRRSVYVFARRNLRYPVFDVFDRPDGNASCARRSRSTTAVQSLLMLNSRASLDLARRLAGRLFRDEQSSDERILLAYRRTLGRPPDEREFQLARSYLNRQQALIAEEGRDAKKLALPQPLPPGVDAPQAAAVVDFCLALFNTSEFVYVD
jgi:hypothetical protein